MTEDTKIIFFSALLVFALSSIYIVIAASMLNFTNLVRQGSMHQVNMVQIDRTYRLATKMVISEYSAMQTDLQADRISRLRQRLLALTVPAQFRDLHYSLVAAMDEMATYLKDGDSNQKQASQDKIAKAKKNYDWLN